MNSLTFTEGTGRLLRSEHAVAYAEEPADDLFALFTDDRPVDFKAVASIIVANNFEMPPFVVIALDSARLFVFGNLDVELGDERLSGSGNDTWVEREVDLTQAVTTGDTGEVRGNLTLGWVSAGGFYFGTHDPAASGDATTAISDAPVAPANQASLAPLPTAAEPDVHEEESEEIDESESVELETAPSTSSDIGQAPVAAPTPEAEIEEGEATDQWDPLADPEVDLERIGEQEVVDTSVPPPPTPSVAIPIEPGEPDLAVETSDDTSAHGLYTPEDTRDTRTPPPPQRPPIPPPPPTPAGITPPPAMIPSDIPPPPDAHASTKALPTIPAPADFQPPTLLRSAKGNIRFDDGQSATVDAGVYVGRHPTKNGLPDKYSSVTIRGEHVSRLHFELAIDGVEAVVRDLGSNSGTEVEINGRRIPVPDGGMQISPGAKIIFADRWAIYETE